MRCSKDFISTRMRGDGKKNMKFLSICSPNNKMASSSRREVDLVNAKFKRKISKTQRYKWMRNSPDRRQVTKKKRVEPSDTPVLDRILVANRKT